MPTAKSAKVVKVVITSGVKGQSLTVRNRTTGEQLNIVLQDTGKAVVDLQNFTNGYSDGDIIDFSVSGERIGQTSLTTNADGSQSVTLSTTAITSGLIRGI